MEQERLWTLLGKKLAGVASGEELQELELLLLAYGEETETIEIIERMWASRDTQLSAGEDPVRNKIEESLGFSLEDSATLSALPAAMPSQEQLRPVRSIRLWPFGAVAACIAGALWIKSAHLFQKQEKEGAMNVLYTRKKSHSNLQLPDGTLVVLNENSRISYNADFGETKREIVLQGEAYFDVAKNAGTPLIIHAGNVDIRVLGTTFNVKAYPQDKTVETSLLKGAVEVSSRQYPKQIVLLKPNEKIAISALIKDPQDEPILNDNAANLQEEPDSIAASSRSIATPPRQPLTADQTSPADTLSYYLQPLKTEHTSHLVPEIAWIYRRLVFDHESFETVAGKMEKWYDVNIYFEDDDLKKEVFTGSFNKENLEEALKALQYTYQFSYVIKKKEVFIKRK